MQKKLLAWYQENKRTLPWRKNRDPYRIWISEVMLQQTTVAAVVPYYEKFMQRFPKIKNLAEASEPEVLEMWAGLGYYSRARNIHKAAKIIAANGFPQKAHELIELPGFGPYTSRAVASLAFNEAVGVLDGNVIRILSRVYGLKTQWWLPKERQQLQLLADELAQTPLNADLNQAMMELGATLCTPQKPLCLMCPWKKNCKALEKELVSHLPLPKPRQKDEIWQWDLNISIKKNRIYLEPNQSTPFLSQLYFPPGQARSLNAKPEKYDLRHSVTKYDIYINLHKKRLNKPDPSRWFELSSVKQTNPSSLITKILKKTIE